MSATPLTATPLGDALARAEEGVRYWTDLAQAEARDAATLRARVAALEAAHTEALDALEKLCAAQKHVLEVRCAGDDEYMAACDGAESILAKAGRR